MSEMPVQKIKWNAGRIIKALPYLKGLWKLSKTTAKLYGTQEWKSIKINNADIRFVLNENESTSLPYSPIVEKLRVARIQTIYLEGGLFTPLELFKLFTAAVTADLSTRSGFQIIKIGKALIHMASILDKFEIDGKTIFKESDFHELHFKKEFNAKWLTPHIPRKIIKAINLTPSISSLWSEEEDRFTKNYAKGIFIATKFKDKSINEIILEEKSADIPFSQDIPTDPKNYSLDSSLRIFMPNGSISKTKYKSVLQGMCLFSITSRKNMKMIKEKLKEPAQYETERYNVGENNPVAGIYNRDPKYDVIGLIDSILYSSSENAWIDTSNNMLLRDAQKSSWTEFLLRIRRHFVNIAPYCVKMGDILLEMLHDKTDEEKTIIVPSPDTKLLEKK